MTVDLYWLPLGAGGHFVRLNGRLFEAASALRHHRRPSDLYHSALRVRADGRTYAIEMAPVWNDPAPERGVVATGPVGSRVLGRWAMFRYEVRCRPDGLIPDLAHAVDSPRRLSDDRATAAAIVRLVPAVPRLVWGRDQLHAGEMWNSNSVIAWLLTGSGLDASAISPPGGRAPGWAAGIVAAETRLRETGSLAGTHHASSRTSENRGGRGSPKRRDGRQSVAGALRIADAGGRRRLGLRVSRNRSRSCPGRRCARLTDQCPTSSP